MHLLYHDAEKNTIHKHQLFGVKDNNPDTCRLSLLPIKGAMGVNLTVIKERKIIKQLEIPSKLGHAIEVKFEKITDDQVLIELYKKEHVILPNDEIYSPMGNFNPMTETDKLDILFLIDGTMRSAILNGNQPLDDSMSEFLVESPKIMSQISEKLKTFVNTLQDHYKKIRFSVLLFADTRIEGIRAANLSPDYLLYPEEDAERYFMSWDEKLFNYTMDDLSGSSGGDYVDAVADGLKECLRYSWCDHARKLVFLIGDSPGFSLLNPTPVILGIEANLVIREHDIDTELKYLHQCGIEVMTLYMTEEESFKNSRRATDKLKEYTKKQYADMASLAEYSDIWLNWKADKAAKTFTTFNELLGKHYCYPIIHEKMEH